MFDEIIDEMGNFIYMKAKTILLAVGGILGFIAYRKYTLATKLTISITDLDVSISPFRVRIVLMANNPTSVSASLDSINGFITANGNNVATVSFVGPVTVVPGLTRIPIDIEAIYAGALNFALDWITNRNKIVLMFNGTIAVDGVSLPVNQKIV